MTIVATDRLEVLIQLIELAHAGDYTVEKIMGLAGEKELDYVCAVAQDLVMDNRISESFHEHGNPATFNASSILTKYSDTIH